MSYRGDEEMIGRLMRQAYRPVSQPACLREQIRERLIAEVEGYLEDSSNKLWARPRLVIPIMASIASGLIIYGCWISMILV